MRVSVERRSGAIMDAVPLLARAGVSVDDVAMRRPTLDDVFLALTGHGAEPEAADRAETSELETAA